MAGETGKLTALAIKAAGQGKHFDGGGLFLHVTAAGRYWRLKYRVAGKEKLLALGVYPEVSLADARKRRDEARRVIGEGVEIQERAGAYERRRRGRQCQHLPGGGR